MTHEAGEEYVGTADVVVDGQTVSVEVHLKGNFEPHDGRFHWYGRIRGLEAAALGSTVELRTPHGTTTGRISEPDPWGRLRITGSGTPPF